jgi:hypothetical protein
MSPPSVPPGKVANVDLAATLLLDELDELEHSLGPCGCCALF